MEYYIFVTNNCNMDCTYCCGVGISKTSTTVDRPAYSFKELENFLIYTQKEYSSDSVDIVFFGGEPTLNPSYLKEFINYFGNELCDYPINYILHTNGLLLHKVNREILQRLKLIILSINYEKIPQTGLNKTYFSEIIENIKTVRTLTKTKILARLTITEQVSLYTNIMQVSSFFDYVYWQVQNCEKFNDFDKYYENYRYEIGLVFDHWYGYFQRGFLINFVPFVSAVNLMLSRDNENILCGFNTRCINIQTDGTCYSCPESMNDPRFTIGDIWAGVQFSTRNLNISKCKTCDLITTCCGRCGRMHIVYDANHVEEYCTLTRIMFSLFQEKEREIRDAVNHFPEFQVSLKDHTYEYTEYIP